MSSQHRIRIIYVKELVDILRDRRTLIAMIVVPILLYPLLMLGSIQAVSVQSGELRQAKLTVIGPNEQQIRILQEWVAQDEEITRRLQALNKDDRAALFGRGTADEPPPLDERAATESQSPESPDDGANDQAEDSAEEDRAQPAWETPDSFDFKYDETTPNLDLARRRMRALIQARQVQLGVILEVRQAGDPLREQYVVEIICDPEEIRSATALSRIGGVLERRAVDVRLRRLDDLDIPPIVITPFVPMISEVVTPGSILGQILPLILVLMTITGAIYPAIDLTAGERERGTLETLMVCPVPVLDLVVGKFLVVTTVAIMGAALNLASVSATVYFGGFAAAVEITGDQGFPLGALPLILLCLIPFAILMSAIMIAVCSYARTFKEAQNYVTPVIMAVLIPGGIAALPASRLEGVMLVMPVANMVLLTKELLLGSTIGAGALLSVLLSTSLYAAAAVAIATKVFGTESVIFSDTASLKNTFTRRLMRPSERPTLSAAVLVVAVLFPVWFYVQSSVQSGDGYDQALRRTGVLMPIFFVLVPVAVCLYFKINIARTFALAAPPGRHLLAGALIGLSAWVLGHELSVAQRAILPAPDALAESNEVLMGALAQLTPWMALLLLAIIPAFCEEALFRGFLLGGLGTTARKWTAIVAAGCIFGVFHYYIFKFPVTALLGMLLGYLCWQSRSLWPGVLMHALHNSIPVSLALWPHLPPPPRIHETDPSAPLPMQVPNLLNETVFCPVLMQVQETQN
ncbi:MAG: CPBP family intramembrane metalloprotease [bacterium]|nr:CPBP family intramembrane metalloprotease [bacterium]